MIRFFASFKFLTNQTTIKFLKSKAKLTDKYIWGNWNWVSHNGSTHFNSKCLNFWLLLWLADYHCGLQIITNSNLQKSAKSWFSVWFAPLGLKINITLVYCSSLCSFSRYKMSIECVITQWKEWNMKIAQVCPSFTWAQMVKVSTLLFAVLL